jgi:hypothetical protein
VRFVKTEGATYFVFAAGMGRKKFGEAIIL